jgi:butyrate kinase
MQENGKDESLLVVNPGSTSTRVAGFRGGNQGPATSLAAPPAGTCEDLWGEFPFRLAGIREWMGEVGMEPGGLDAVVGRGGLFRPVEGGTYRVTENMLADARENRQGVHASNLGCALAHALAQEAGRASGRKVEAYVVDPVSTDEFHDLARFSGLERIPRISLSHALSIHALVHEVCKEEDRKVLGSRFVVAHLGGGISVCPVADGRILDANNANSGGPFSPTRAGGLPTQELMTLCYSGEHTLAELREMTVKHGGLMSYLGTGDAQEVEARIRDGDEDALMVYRAMGYQIAKEIGAMATALNGKVDRILVTGGLAASELLTGWIKERVEFVAPVDIRPGVEEMTALALGALGCLRGEHSAKEY